MAHTYTGRLVVHAGALTCSVLFCNMLYCAVLCSNTCRKLPECQPALPKHSRLPLRQNRPQQEVVHVLGRRYGVRHVGCVQVHALQAVPGLPLLGCPADPRPHELHKCRLDSSRGQHTLQGMGQVQRSMPGSSRRGRVVRGRQQRQAWRETVLSHAGVRQPRRWGHDGALVGAAAVGHHASSIALPACALGRFVDYF
jgi:hypothetical protein